MICMKRITVSLPDDAVETIERAVALGQAKSVSAYVLAALTEYDKRPTLEEILNEWDRELGPVPPGVAASVDREVEKYFGPLDPATERPSMRGEQSNRRTG